jgi:hypothetical protein
MKKMPEKLKNKIRKLQKACEDSARLTQEVYEMIEEYGINPDNFNACGNGDVQTEALAFVTNAEGIIEDNIEEIENVFLYYVNKKGE